MNIEKLAIEHVQFNGDCEGHELYCFTKEQLEAFAKALQSSEPVTKPDAWLVPMILDFTDAKKVHFTRSEKGKNLTDDELKSELQGTVIWKAETVYINDSNEPVTDKYGVRHYAKPLFTHPPASVSLEKYNKLLDALREKERFIELAFQAHMNLDLDVQAIAEAEGKEG